MAEHLRGVSTQRGVPPTAHKHDAREVGHHDAVQWASRRARRVSHRRRQPGSFRARSRCAAARSITAATLRGRADPPLTSGAADHDRPDRRGRYGSAPMAGPLEGIRVVELGVWVAGPAAGGILADWGADVVKVEPIGGDPGRLFQFMLGGDMPTNPVFDMDNRGKRSIAMDLTTDDGRAVIEELLAQADVFVTNVRLGGLERLGLDHSSVTARHRRLVYAAVTGYGMEGAEADSGAFDVAGFWARSGIAHLLTPDGGDPPFQRGGMGDHSTALATAAGVCAALVARQRTGEGQLVSTSLLRQGAYTISFDLSITLGWGLTLNIGRRDTMGNPAMNNYTAGDGRRFWLVGLEPARHWEPLARAVGRPEWIDDERYATPGPVATTRPSWCTNSMRSSPPGLSTSGPRPSQPSPSCSGRPSSHPTTCWPTRSSRQPADSWRCPTGRAHRRWSPPRSTSRTRLGHRGHGAPPGRAQRRDPALAGPQRHRDRGLGSCRRGRSRQPGLTSSGSALLAAVGQAECGRRGRRAVASPPAHQHQHHDR